MNFLLDNPINKLNIPKNPLNKSSNEFDKIGLFTVDLSFTQIDSYLKKLVINLTSSGTSQGTTFFIPRYTRLEYNNKPINSFIDYTKFDDKKNNLSESEIKKKQLELFTSKSNLEKYMNKYKSNFELTAVQKNIIKNEGDLKVSATSPETIFLQNAKFILKNILFNNTNASFLYRIKNGKKVPSYIKVNKDEINAILTNITFVPDRYSSKNIEDNIVQEVQSDNLKQIKKEIDREIKNITDIYGSNEGSRSLIAEINKRRNLLFLYLNYKIKVIQDTIKATGPDTEANLNENILNIWNRNILNNEELKKFNIGSNFNDFSNEVKKLNKQFKKLMNQRIRRSAKYKLILILDPNLIVIVPEKPLNIFNKEDRAKLKVNLKTKFQNLKRSCKKGDQDLSAKQKKIIEMCKKICEDEKNCKWCDVCSSIVNCSLNQTIKSKCREKKKEEKLKAAAKGTTKGGSKKKHSKKKHSKKKKKRIKKLTRKRQLNLNK